MVHRIIPVLSEETLYDILQLNPGTCELVDVKKAYKKLALLHHPDRVSPEMVEAATDKFRTIREAFEVLSDASRKRQYDSELGLDRKKKRKVSKPASSVQRHIVAVPSQATRKNNGNRKNNVQSGNADRCESLSSFLIDVCKVAIIVLVFFGFTLMFIL